MQHDSLIIIMPARGTSPSSSLCCELA